MAFSSKKTALTSLLLIGALSFTACGASNSATDAASSAVSSAQSVSTDGVQTFADAFVTAMTNNKDGQNKLVDMAKDSNFLSAMTTLSSSLGGNLSSVASAISNLNDDQKNALKKLTESDANTFKNLTDYSGMTDDQKLALDFTNFLLSSAVTGSADKVNKDNNKVNLNDLKVDGNNVDVPVKALEDAATTDSAKQLFANVPAVYVNGTWKLNGMKYFENLKKTTSGGASASASASSK